MLGIELSMKEEMPF